jgi:hypothetical protein
MLAVLIGWNVYLFVGSSNTLGEFESGLGTAWLGPCPRC